MLAYLNNFTVSVKNTDFVVYPDHENPYKFYCYRTRPRIAIDPIEKKPIFQYTSYKWSGEQHAGGNKDIGILTMTVNIGPTDDEIDFIKSYISKEIKAGNPTFVDSSKLYPEHLGYKGQNNKDNIVLATPHWEQGTTRLVLLGDVNDNATDDMNFKFYSTGEIKPCLTGNCHATFYEGFTEDGDTLLTNYLDKIVKGKSNNNLQANVHYDLTGRAYVPSLKATITIDYAEIFNQCQKLLDRLDDYYSFKYLFEFPPTDELWMAKDDIKEMLSNFRDNGTLKIKLEDYGFSDETQKDIENQLISVCMDAITNHVLPIYFEEEEVEDANSTYGAVIRDPKPKGRKSSSTPSRPGGTGRPTPLQVGYQNQGSKLSGVFVAPDARLATNNEVYKFNNKPCSKPNFKIEFERSTTMTFEDHPNDNLTFSGFTPKQIADLVTVVDMEEPNFRRMCIPVNVYAPFEEDNIQRIEVDVQYVHENPITHKERNESKLCVFHSESDNYSFNVNLVLDENGQFISTYKYSTRIIFKGQSMGPKDGWSAYEETDAQQLNIDYGIMGYERVQLKAGNFESEYLKEAMVHIEYLGAQGKSGSWADILLTAENSPQSFKCFRHNSDIDSYEYSVEYRYQDGTVYSVGPVVDNKEELTLSDPFDTPAEADFNVRIGRGLLGAELEVRVTDGKYEKTSSHQLPIDKQFESWRWTTRVRREGTPKIEWRYNANYAGENGEDVKSEWKPVADTNISVRIPSNPNEELPPTEDQSQLQLVTTGINWEMWQLAFIYVEDDKGKKQTITLDPSGQVDRIIPVDVTYTSDGHGTCRISGLFMAKDGSSIKMPVTECSEPVFIIQDPKS